MDLFRDEFLELARGPVDVLFCNEDEARSLLENSDIDQCARQLGQWVPRVAVTLGANGALLVEHGQLIRVPGVTTEAVDTTGAGDMFAAGVLYGLTNNLSFQQSAQLANQLAARIVSQLGARLSEPIDPDDIPGLAGLGTEA